MKKAINLKLFIAALLSSLLLITACTKEETPDSIISVDSNGYTQFNAAALKNKLNTLPTESLTDFEKQSLIFMREEEKLAFDTYKKLYEKWGHQIFNNISSSEQTHMDAVLSLLNKYSLEDPASGKAIGVFTDTTLQKLYNQLYAIGTTSLADGLKVGAAIEEIDIRDLNTLSKQVDNQDILMVYSNLTKGSRNHLRAFVRVLKTQGVTYTPQYLTQAEYDAIINGTLENGN